MDSSTQNILKGSLVPFQMSHWRWELCTATAPPSKLDDKWERPRLYHLLSPDFCPFCTAEGRTWFLDEMYYINGRFYHFINHNLGDNNFSWEKQTTSAQQEIERWEILDKTSTANYWFIGSTRANKTFLSPLQALILFCSTQVYLNEEKVNHFCQYSY